jgi:MFS family permease
MGAGYLLIWSAGGWAIIVLGLLVAGIGQGLWGPNLRVWLADETPPGLRGRVLGGLTTAVFLGIFLSPIVGQPVSAAIGFRALCLSAGALLLVLASLSWVTRRRFRSLTGCVPLEMEILDTGTGEVEVVAQLHGPLVKLTVTEEVEVLPTRQTSALRCGEQLRAACWPGRSDNDLQAAVHINCLQREVYNCVSDPADHALYRTGARLSE